jgi:hypothetical protein
MAVNSPLRPTFQQVTTDEAHDLLTKANTRRDWTEVREALMGGATLFFADDQISPRNVKYLTLSLQRRGVNRTLHARTSTHEGVSGRLVWLGDEKS